MLGLVMKSNRTYLFVSYTDFANGRLTGGHRRFLELANGLQRDSRVVVVSPVAPQLHKGINLTHYQIDLVKSDILPKHIQGAMSIRKALKGVSEVTTCDYAISFNPVHTLLLNNGGAKNIVSLFREDLIGYMNAIGASGGKKLYSQIQETLAVKVSDLIIVQCESDRKNLIERNKKHCRDIESKLCVQVNNADASWMGGHGFRTGFLYREVPEILFVGDFSNERKGHKELLLAAVELLSQGYRFKLLIAGDGRDLELYRSQYGQYDEISFLGRVDDVQSLLARADFMVVPSRIDSCPNTVLEALNLGVPVYGANTGGIPDLIQREEWMFAPDAGAIACFVADLLKTRRFEKDAVVQQERRKTLTFDWPRAVQEQITRFFRH